MPDLEAMKLADRLEEGARGLHPYSLGEIDSPYLDVALPAYLNQAAALLRRNSPTVEELAEVIADSLGVGGENASVDDAARRVAALYERTGE